MKDDQIFPARDLALRGSALKQPQTNLPHRILVAEDDASIREVNAAMLHHSGYEVDAAENGAAAWKALKAGCYDLLITDNIMPVVTGVELLKKVRAAGMDLPVIMATGTVPTHEFARYSWIQPAATLLKPYTFAEMLRTVKDVLRKVEGSAAARRQHPASSPHRILAVDEDRTRTSFLSKQFSRARVR